MEFVKRLGDLQLLRHEVEIALVQITLPAVLVTRSVIGPSA